MYVHEKLEFPLSPLWDFHLFIVDRNEGFDLYKRFIEGKIAESGEPLSDYDVEADRGYSMFVEYPFPPNRIDKDFKVLAGMTIVLNVNNLSTGTIGHECLHACLKYTRDIGAGVDKDGEEFFILNWQNVFNQVIEVVEEAVGYKRLIKYCQSIGDYALMEVFSDSGEDIYPFVFRNVIQTENAELARKEAVELGKELYMEPMTVELCEQLLKLEPDVLQTVLKTMKGEPL